MEIKINTYTVYNLAELSAREFDLLNRAVHMLVVTHPDERLRLATLRQRFEAVEEYNETIAEAAKELE